MCVTGLIINPSFTRYIKMLVFTTKDYMKQSTVYVLVMNAPSDRSNENEVYIPILKKEKKKEKNGNYKITQRIPSKL